MSKTNLTTAAKATSYFNARKPIEMKHALAGDQVTLMIQGDGTFISKADAAAADAKAGKPVRSQYFDSYIFNVNANSMEAVARKENKDLLKDAVAYDQKGEAEFADECFTQWLNNTQLSFNVIADPSRRKYANGDLVKVTLAVADTKAGYKAIVIDKHAYVAPIVIEKKKFDLVELLG